MNACKDCAHYLPGEISGFARCAVSETTDPVSGETEKRFCKMVRIWGPCFAEGKLFQPVAKDNAA